jgi:hypothetical protein
LRVAFFFVAFLATRFFVAFFLVAFFFAAIVLLLYLDWDTTGQTYEHNLISIYTPCRNSLSVC